MKIPGIALTLTILTMLLAGCTASAADNQTGVEAFDRSLAEFQKHLATCAYPAAHILAFARSWNLPEFAIQAYVPKGVAYEKGKTTNRTLLHPEAER
jgi:hypothetical protein